MNLKRNLAEIVTVPIAGNVIAVKLVKAVHVKLAKAVHVNHNAKRTVKEIF